MVSSSSDYSSSSSDEDFRIPMAKARVHAKVPPYDPKFAHDDFLKRKEREEILAEYREKRRRIQRKKQEAEERLRSRPYGVASDSDAEEELVWRFPERKSKPYPPHREIERQVKDDLQAERDEEDLLDAIDGDIEEEFPDDSDSDSEKESEEDSSEDDDDDDNESDDSDD
ncbi:calsequestrin-1-like [Papaver somniferum]|uniref:calsequestrin-1-like n=1 Tax=Papaver somniferum TaxID=3469 RepID=UPI000E6FC399|nr:calsequestrin-1-like [Papaver somniferum]